MSALVQNYATTPVISPDCELASRRFAAPYRLAAVLIDLENVYYTIRNDSRHASATCMPVIVDMLSGVRRYLPNICNESVLRMDAYADFDRMPETPQTELYRLGIETHNVLGTKHKNAADMELCVHAVELLYTRPEIVTFVLVVGDRDYIPVIKHLKRHNRTVRVVGFGGSTQSVSSDLVTIVGREYFIDAMQLMSTMQSGRTTPVPGMHEICGIPEPTLEPVDATSRLAGTILDRGNSVNGERTVDGYANQVVRIIGTLYRGKPEVWLSPLLQRLRSELPHFNATKPQSVIAVLEREGCFRVERRAGVRHDYSVLVMNWDHERFAPLWPEDAARIGGGQ